MDDLMEVCCTVCGETMDAKIGVEYDEAICPQCQENEREPEEPSYE